MLMMLQHGRQNAKASAFYCYLCAGLSAVAAIAAWFMLPSPFLILFTGGCALVLAASGFWYSRIAGQHTPADHAAVHADSASAVEFGTERNPKVRAGSALRSGAGC
jgi:hypothetical protein